MDLPNAPIDIQTLRTLFLKGEMSRDELQEVFYDRWGSDDRYIDVNGTPLYDLLCHNYIDSWVDCFGIVYYDLSRNEFDGMAYFESQFWHDGMDERYHAPNSSLVIAYAK